MLKCNCKYYKNLMVYMNYFYSWKKVMACMSLSDEVRYIL